MIRALEKEAAFAALRINCDKTKMLSLTGAANRTIEVAADQIEAVDGFTYLGSVVAAGGATDMDIDNHINKVSGWHVLNRMGEQQVAHGKFRKMSH